MRTAISDRQSAVSNQRSACSVGAGPVLRTPAVSFDALKMKGWGVEGVALP